MTLIIAEAGVNHNGDQKLAFELVDKAISSGADYIKFQTFKAEKLVTKSAKKAQYQVTNTQSTSSQYQMLKGLELNESTYKSLANYCKKKGIGFMSTAFDSESLSFIVEDLHVDTLKLSSGDLTNLPFLLEHARLRIPIILSTGMASLSEIESALKVVAYGLISNTGSIPDIKEFERAYSSEEGQSALKEFVSVLHCTTEYPTPTHEVNLRAIDTLKNAFKLNTGFSDHSKGIYIPIAAAALGASIIEKHFTLDPMMEGPDHRASLSPEQLKSMVSAIREVDNAKGTGIKAPFDSELENKSAARKSIVAYKKIQAGEEFSDNNLTIMRPGTGMDPSQYWRLLGSSSTRDYAPGDLIDE